MEQLALLAMVGVVAFAFGSVAYNTFGHPKSNWVQVMPYPLLATVVGEGLWAPYLAAGPDVLGVHVVVALVVIPLAVGLDILRESHRGLRGLKFSFPGMPKLSITFNGKGLKDKGATAEG